MPWSPDSKTVAMKKKLQAQAAKAASERSRKMRHLRLLRKIFLGKKWQNFASKLRQNWSRIFFQKFCIFCKIVKVERMEILDEEE